MFDWMQNAYLFFDTPFCRQSPHHALDNARHIQRNKMLYHQKLARGKTVDHVIIIDALRRLIRKRRRRREMRIELSAPIDQIYTNASKAQYAISWYRFVRGYLSNQWAALQDMHLVKNKSSKLGDSWSAKVGLWWIKKSYDIWLSRNNCIHSNQPGLQNRQEAELFARVQQLYNMAEQLPADDREMLDLPIADRLLQPIETIKHWLDLTCVTVANSIQAYRVRLRQRHTPINDIFTTVQLDNDTTTATPTMPERVLRRSTRFHNIGSIFRNSRRGDRNRHSSTSTDQPDPKKQHPRKRKTTGTVDPLVLPPTTTTRPSSLRRTFTWSPIVSDPNNPSPTPTPAGTGPRHSMVTQFRSRSNIFTRSREATHDHHTQHKQSQESLSPHRK